MSKPDGAPAQFEVIISSWPFDEDIWGTAERAVAGALHMIRDDRDGEVKVLRDGVVVLEAALCDLDLPEE